MSVDEKREGVKDKKCCVKTEDERGKGRGRRGSRDRYKGLEGEGRELTCIHKLGFGGHGAYLGTQSQMWGARGLPG